jgi:iron(III) transport system permease protein
VAGDPCPVGRALPYVYLLCRAAFREQSGAVFEVARALGAGPWARFWRVGLPLARPAIAAGVAVVMMETVNDFGAVAHFGVQTLTTGIFSVWLQAGNLPGAAQIAACVLVLVVLLVTLEKLGRNRRRTHASARAIRPVEAQPLRGWRAGAALIACLLPFLGGFVLPVAVLLSHSLEAEQWVAPGLTRALLHRFWWAEPRRSFAWRWPVSHGLRRAALGSQGFRSAPPCDGHRLCHARRGLGLGVLIPPRGPSTTALRTSCCA